MSLPESIQKPLIEGDLETAAQLLKQHNQKQPDDREAQLELSRVYLGLKKFKQAEEIFAPLLEKNENDGDALAIRGLWYQIQGQLEEAKSDYTNALQQRPQLSAVHYNLGRLLVHQNTLSEDEAQTAEKHLREAAKLEKDHFLAHFELAALYTRTNQPQKAAKEAETTIGLNPLHLPSYLFLGELFTQVGEVDGVIRLYKAGLQVNPLAHALRDELIKLYSQKGKLDGAIDVALEQSKMRGAFEDFLLLGTLSVQLGKAGAAEVAFLKAEQVKKDDWRAPFNLGELYRGSGQIEEAQKAYKRSLAVTFTPQAHTGIGVIAFESDDPKQLEQAEQHFENAFKLAPEKPIHLLNLALALQKAGKHESIKEALKMAQHIIPPEDEMLKRVQAISEKIS